MKKKNLLFAWFVAASLLGYAPTVSAQIELTVSDGSTTDNYIPIWGNWLDDANGVHSQMLYPEKEISAMIGSQITKLTFYSESPSSNWTPKSNETAKWKVGTISETQYSSSVFFSTESFTTVKEGIVNIDSNSLLTIEFNEPFIYTGGTLVVDFSTTNAYTYGSKSFYGTSKSSYSSAYTRGGTSSVTRAYFSPKTTFTYVPGELPENEMRVNASEIAFNKTFTGNSNTASVRVTNMGTNHLTITSVEGLSAPFAASFPADAIESLSSAEITFTFAPTEAGNFSQTATIVTSAGEASVTLSGDAISADVPDTWYKETFDDISASAKIPSGWNITASSDVDFSIYEQDGDKGLAYNQDNPGEDWYGDTGEEVFLVSPYLKGNIMALVRKTSTTGSVKFYNMKLNGTSFSKSSEIRDVEFTDALSTSEWSLATLTTDADSTYIGIVLNHAAINLFAAEERLPVTSIAVSNPASAPEKIVADASGRAEIPVTFTIKNTGTEAVEGTNYQIYIKFYDEVLATLDGVSLAPNESKLIEHSITYQIKDLSQESERIRIDAAESLSNTKLTAIQWVTIYTYKAILAFNNNNGGMLTQPVDFEYFQGSRSDMAILRNRGKAPLVIDAITAIDGIEYQLPEGVTCPFTLAPEETVQMDYSIVAPGRYSGDCIVFSHNGDGETALAIEAVCIDQEAFYVDFETGMPSTWIVGKNWLTKSRGGGYSPKLTSNNRYYCDNTNLDATMLITPRLTVSENDSLGFCAYKTSGSSSLSVYYSTDRSNWTLAQDIQFNAVNIEEPKTVSNIPAGEYYIGFLGGYVGLDNVYGHKLAPALAHDAMIVEFTGTSNGMVNYADTFKVVIRNLLETPDYFTVQFIDGETVTDEVNIESIDLDTITFAFTPHTEGMHNLKVVVSSESYILNSPTLEYIAAKESLSNAIAIHPSSTTSTSIPLRLNYRHSASQILYTAEQLREIPIGAKITYIAFPHQKVTSQSSSNYNIKVWIASTDVAELTGDRINIDGMTPIYDGKINLEINKDNSALTYMLPEPMLYDGKNLCIVIASDSTHYGATISFLASNTETANQVLDYYTDAKDPSSPDLFATQKASSNRMLPELRIGLESEPVLVSGVVTNAAGTPVNSASMTFTKDNVIYNCTTDAAGTYSVNIMQEGDYHVTINKDGFLPYTVNEPVTVGNESLQKDFVVELITGINAAQTAKTVVYIENGICHIDAADTICNVQVVSLAGQTIRTTRNNGNHAIINMHNIPSGVYLINVTTETGSFVYKVVKR